MATAFIVLLCTVIIVGFFLEVAIGGGARVNIQPPPGRPPPRDDPE